MKNNVELRDYLLHEHNILVAVGMGIFSDNVLRVGHMGKAGTRDYLIPCLLGMEEYVRNIEKQDIPFGASRGYEGGGDVVLVDSMVRSKGSKPLPAKP